MKGITISSLKKKTLISSFRTTLVGFFTNSHSWQYWHYCQLCIPIYLSFASSFATYYTSKLEIRYISKYNRNTFHGCKLHWDQFPSNARPKKKLAVLYCGEFVKNLSVNATIFEMGQHCILMVPLYLSFVNSDFVLNGFIP